MLNAIFLALTYKGSTLGKALQRVQSLVHLNSELLLI